MGKLKDPNFYNMSSSKTLGWLPSYFGCDDFDEELVRAIKKFQKEHNLEVDGLCGNQTFKAIMNDRQMQLELWESQNREKEKQLEKKNYIVCGKDKIEFEYDKFIGLFDEGNLRMEKGFRSRNGKKPICFVVHWDGCLSSKSCRDILEKRGLSVQFAIDNDATIYQLTDMDVSAQHVGNLNSISVGVEITNAVSLKYQNYYKSKGFSSRSIIKDTIVHGKKYGTILGFYDCQIQSLKRLIKVVCDYYDISLETPLDKNGEMTKGISKEAMEGKFHGVIHHYMVNKEKQDAIGLDLKKLLEEIKEGK